MSLFTNDMAFYLENHKKARKIPSNQRDSKVVGNKINMQQSVMTQCTKDQNQISRVISFMIVKIME